MLIKNVYLKIIIYNNIWNSNQADTSKSYWTGVENTILIMSPYFEPDSKNYAYFKLK